MSSKEFDSTELIKKNVSPNELLEDTKESGRSMYFGGDVTIGKVYSICDGKNENEVHITLDIIPDLVLCFTKEQLTELRDLIKNYLDKGESKNASNCAQNKTKMDLFVDIGRCETSIFLGPGGIDYNEDPDSLALRMHDSRGNQFELGLDSGQIRTIHSIFSKFVKAQDTIEEVMRGV